MRDAYDLVVIGGGIHGAGVAQAAAAQGYSVLVVEKNRLAGGTSSRSSKLIHGGLRYLEGGHFGLVRECLRERAILLRLAPDLVHLKPFYIPIYQSTRRRPWQVRTGLSIYALLGKLSRATRFEKVSRRKWDQLDGLQTEGLEAVYRYYDAQTNDARLTEAVMMSAMDLGAELALPAEFIRADLDEDGCTIEIALYDTTLSIRTKMLINAAGPWANRVLDRITPALPCREISLVQGTHLLLRGGLEQGFYYVESPRDGRAVFAMPWDEHTLVGTTETPYEGDPDQVAPFPEEEAYLLEVMEHYFPQFKEAEAGEVLDSFAGLRVLPREEGQAFKLSRETILKTDRIDHPRVLTIYGGKLTAYRATAESVMKRLIPTLPARRKVADTLALPLKSAA